ncbi:MAG: hypothetical protein RSC66_13515, partial [Comamonas sp.]
LFSNKVHNQASRERLFMIKPRLVTLPTGVTSDINALRAPVEAPAAMPVSSQTPPPVAGEKSAAPHDSRASVVDYAGIEAVPQEP